ncbi:MAG TPA: prepilin-type N-terminal cleavage/methylation domain-containing protein [Pyrinomonadaceae bacterium]
MPRLNTNSHSHGRRPRGFSVVELLLTMTVLTIVTTFGFIGITKARATVRLSGAAREYASYIEKARIFSIRSHADTAAERATVAINANKNSYDVTMDLDGDGGMDTRTINLPSGVSFETIESIAFDWRGRTWSTVSGVTTPNAQVSIRLQNSDDSISVDVTGSGDVTIDSQVFDDSVPNVSLHVGDLASGATPVPTPASSSTPAPGASPSPIDGTLAEVIPTPSPVIDLGGGLPTPTPSPTASSTPTPSPSPSATPRSTPTPTPATCNISTDKIAAILTQEGTTTIKVSHDGTSSLSITGTSSKPSDLQVTPGGSQTVGAGSSVTFTVKSKKSSGTYYVTFSSGCGTKAVPVVVL